MGRAIKYFNSDRLKSIFAYLILILASLSISAILFMDGYPHGHDTEFHFANIYDAYYNLINNHNSPISANLASGFGCGKGLFYSPLPHMSVALLGVLLVPFGLTLLDCFKITLFITYFISGIFAYKLGMAISKGNKGVATIAGVFYILFPYRAFDAYVRLAFAETFVFMFIPLFFLGLYNLCNKEELDTLAFIEIILGASGLFLSHNLTAFYTFVFGFIYILFNIKGILFKIKDKRLYIYSLITIIITVGLTSITLFSSIDLLKNGGYNLTIKERMWTSRENVMGRVDNYFVYSGFLNIGHLNYAYHMFVTAKSLHLDLGLFVLFSALFIILSEILKRVKYVSKYNVLISSIIYLILVCTIIYRLEVLFAALLFIITKLLLSLDDNIFDFKLSELKNPSLWYLVIMIPLAIYLIASPTLWRYMPSLFLNIQFPWRLWVFVAIFGSMLTAIIAGRIIKGRVLASVMAIASVLLCIASNPILQLRLNRIHPDPDKYKLYDDIEYVIDESWFKKQMSFGANAEYLPDIYYFGIPKYDSEYKNSLYYIVNFETFWNLGNNPYALDPIFLEGSGKIKVNSKLAPIYDMEIEAKSDSLIQVPLFYYDGYEIEIINTKTNERIKRDGIMVDGLVSFNLEEGSYTVRTNFVGTPLRQFSVIFNKLSQGALFIFIFYYYDEKLKRYIISL